MKFRSVFFAICMVLAVSGQGEGAVSFQEKFALAEDREKALEELIPGTEAYYFYHCLQYQNTNRLDEVDVLLKTWIERHKRTERVREIQHRQALLRYETDPKAALEYMRRELGLHFNHEREVVGRKPGLPTELDPALIQREALTKRALAWHQETVLGFEDAAFDWLITQELDGRKRRDLLQRLRRPDYANLPELIIADLAWERSGGYGSIGIHKQLLREQLDELLRLEPGLLNQSEFVQVYLCKLWPNPDTDWRRDDAAREAYLDRLEAFAVRLNPAHNSLKAHVLHQRLLHGRSKGDYDKERFMEYIRLPRNAAYMNPKYWKERSRQRNLVNNAQRFQEQTQFPMIGDEEPLIRSYLQHFFVSEEDYKAYERYLLDSYLKEVFAETKVVHGLGDKEQWYSWLSPATYQSLKERIDLEFDPANPSYFAVDDAVALDVWVKNIDTLIVKVFEINTQNYYRKHNREVNTDIDLDGLVAHVETTSTYEEPPLRRVKRHFSFPSLKNPGVYVVELIGNGKSSRALIRKGRLSYLERPSVAGHVFTVLNEATEVLKDATLWLAGHEYTPDTDGAIVVPYTNNAGRQSLILSQGAFSSLDAFIHQSENYALTAGFHVDRESLRPGSTAKLAIRPVLQVNGVPAPLGILEDVVLEIRSANREGTVTSKEIRDPALTADSLYEYEFRVPAELQTLAFVLKAKVENLSQSEKIDLSASKALACNQVDLSDKTEALHMSRMGGGHALELLGKSGEAKADRAVNIALKHRDFRDEINVSLQTNAAGRILLGELEGIAWLKAEGPDGQSMEWQIFQDSHSYPMTLHGAVGTPLQIAYMGSAKKALRAELSLLEIREAQFVSDRFDALGIQNGFITISDLPRGDYSLFIKPANRTITIRMTEGRREGQYILSDFRHLKSMNPKPIQITTVETQAETVKIQLANVSQDAKVHLAATRFMPAQSLYDHLSVLRPPEPGSRSVPRMTSAYISGRNIGDEYQYILNRKQAGKFAGNMLERPGLLISPWAISKTQTERQDAKQGEAPAAAPASAKPEPSPMLESMEVHVEKPGEPGEYANVDFLSGEAVLMLNLVPDENGVVTIEREGLNGRQHLHIVATDPANTVYREISLEEQALPFRDLRMARGLDPATHATEQKQISVLDAETEFSIADATTAQFEIYDTLQKVHALYATLTQNPTLLEFNFITRWPSLADEERRALYSKHACHELNFFLYKKDPDFFTTVVQPFIANKRNKTFLDHWLLEAPLDAYLKPWAHRQLNVFERILLAERVPDEAAITAREITDLYALIPPNVEQFNHLFKTALQGSALDSGRGGGGGMGGGMMGGMGGGREGGAMLGRADRSVARNRVDHFFADSDADGWDELSAGQMSVSADGTAEVADQIEALGYAAKQAERKKMPRKMSRALSAALPQLAVEELEDDLDRRKGVRQLYQKLDTTEEWVENNYYQLPIEQQNANLIPVSAFWRDYAQRPKDAPFLSTHLAEAARSFPEMMLALAVLDLPFAAAEHETSSADEAFKMTTGAPLVVFHKEIRDADATGEAAPLLVSQNLFRHGDRYIQKDNERIDKFIRDEFLAQVVYGCQVAVTNPTSSLQKIETLIQVPQGAVPVANGKYTRGVNVNLDPYNTTTLEYFFYFPAPGAFSHYPVHVSKNGQLIAFAEPLEMKVVLTPSTIDRASWDYISQNGSPEQVVEYLNNNNLNRTRLDRIGWRMKDAAYFAQVIALLEKRHAFDPTLWSYALYHNAADILGEYLQHRDDFVERCGAHIDTALLTIDPVIRKRYQHMEYNPLVNARAHQLGGTRKILNDRFAQQYNRLTNVLRYRPELDDDDRMAVTYYMLLQDRVEEALTFYAQVDRETLDSKLPYDYLGAYLAFYQEDTPTARAIAERYTDYPVERWAKLFDNVRSQLDEIEGAETAVIDEKSRTQRQTQLAATEPGFDFEVEARQVALNFQNITECRVNYYLMDIELLFSRNPFAQQYADHFSTVRPNDTQALRLDADGNHATFPLPERFHSSNVMVEIEGAGVKKSQTYYANALTLQTIENYGQLKVMHKQTGKALSKVYVKVFARTHDGQTRFYKDGYTDLRGRFDYAALSTDEIDGVEKFSFLVLSEEHGAMVREAAPPKR
jgi:hypothetical protein